MGMIHVPQPIPVGDRHQCSECGRSAALYRGVAWRHGKPRRFTDQELAEHRRVTDLAYRVPRRAARAAQQRAYAAARPEVIRERNKRYYAANKDAISVKGAAYKARIKAEQPDALRRWRRNEHLRLYGLAPDQYEAMLVAQRGVCAACRSAPSRRPLAVDHDHATGAVRGLLCGPCNLALGLLGDSVDRVMLLADYIGEAAWAPQERSVIVS